MNKCALILFAVTAASFTTIAALNTSESVALRFVPADEAYAAVKEKLGDEASSAVASVDVRTNALMLDSNHAQTPKIREFLAAFDKRRPQLMVRATITRHIEATQTEPARDVILSRPTVITTEDSPVIIKIPGQEGTTSVELRITPVAPPKN